MLLWLSIVPSLVMFADPGAEANPPSPQHIYAGEDVPACGWPSVVRVGADCTGALVHPRVVLTSALCINDGGAPSIRFGETLDGAAKLAETEICRQSPGWTGQWQQGQDYAYCLLRTPVTNVPIVPVAGGCEQAAIHPGARIMHVGFGEDEEGNAGPKKMLDTTAQSITRLGEMHSANGEATTCNDGWGGPTFVYLDPADPEVSGDGSWRMAAIQSWTSQDCNYGGSSVLVSQAIDWIEQDTGIDITPCTDGDGWSPTARCGDAALEPWVASGSYRTACEPGGEVVEWAGTCGAPLDWAPDETAPVVAFAAPATEMQIDLPPGESSASVDIEVTAIDEGWGVQTVELTIRSVSIGQQQVTERDEWQSWTWNAEMPVGSYELIAVATDHAGNVSEPVTVCFGVGQAGCDAAGGEEDGSSTGGGDAGGDDSTSGAAVDDDSNAGATGSGGSETGAGPGAADGDRGDAGCSCRARGESGGAWTWLMLLALVRLRRRQRATPRWRTRAPV